MAQAENRNVRVFPSEPWLLDYVDPTGLAGALARCDPLAVDVFRQVGPLGQRVEAAICRRDPDPCTPSCGSGGSPQLCNSLKPRPLRLDTTLAANPPVQLLSVIEQPTQQHQQQPWAQQRPSPAIALLLYVTRRTLEVETPTIARAAGAAAAAAAAPAAPARASRLQAEDV